jgi:hypothetical protein
MLLQAIREGTSSQSAVFFVRKIDAVHIRLANIYIYIARVM